MVPTLNFSQPYSFFKSLTEYPSLLDPEWISVVEWLGLFTMLLALALEMLVTVAIAMLKYVWSWHGMAYILSWHGVVFSCGVIFTWSSVIMTMSCVTMLWGGVILMWCGVITMLSGVTMMWGGVILMWSGVIMMVSGMIMMLDGITLIQGGDILMWSGLTIKWSGANNCIGTSLWRRLC